MIKSLQMSKTDLETRLDEAQGNANVLKGKFDVSLRKETTSYRPVSQWTSRSLQICTS